MTKFNTMDRRRGLRCCCLFFNRFRRGFDAAQGGESVAELKQRVEQLKNETNTPRPLPLLEKIVLANQTMRRCIHLGFALIAQGANTKDAATRRACASGRASHSLRQGSEARSLCSKP